MRIVLKAAWWKSRPLGARRQVQTGKRTHRSDPRQTGRRRTANRNARKPGAVTVGRDRLRKDMKKLGRCTECGGDVPDAEAVRNLDAADVPHVFHMRCWAQFRWWLAGHGGPPSKAFVKRIEASVKRAFTK